MIDDLGVQRAHTAATLKLPAPVNLAFFPHSRDLPRQVAQARQRGHAIMLHMPMAPRDPGVNPGPRPLTAKAKPKQNRNRLQSALAAFGNHRPIAVNNHMGSAFTAQRAQMRAVLQVLARRNLIFLDSLTAPDSRARAVGRAVGTTVLARDVFLDHRRSAKAIRAALAKTERIARRYGSAIAIGHPYPETRRALAAWLPTLKDKGIRQVRLDRLVTPQAAPERSLASTRNQAPESL